LKCPHSYKNTAHKYKIQSWHYSNEAMKVLTSIGRIVTVG